MKIIVEKASQAAAMDSGTCNSGSNSSGNQGSMCKASDRPLANVTDGHLPSLATPSTATS